jgi:hypothetical protein
VLDRIQGVDNPDPDYKELQNRLYSVRPAIETTLDKVAIDLMYNALEHFLTVHANNLNEWVVLNQLNTYFDDIFSTHADEKLMFQSSKILELSLELLRIELSLVQANHTRQRLLKQYEATPSMTLTSQLDRELRNIHDRQKELTNYFKKIQMLDIRKEAILELYSLKHLNQINGISLEDATEIQEQINKEARKFELEYNETMKIHDATDYSMEIDQLIAENHIVKAIQQNETIPPTSFVQALTDLENLPTLLTKLMDERLDAHYNVLAKQIQTNYQDILQQIVDREVATGNIDFSQLEESVDFLLSQSPKALHLVHFILRQKLEEFLSSKGIRFNQQSDGKHYLEEDLKIKTTYTNKIIKDIFNIKQLGNAYVHNDFNKLGLKSYNKLDEQGKVERARLDLDALLNIIAKYQDKAVVPKNPPAQSDGPNIYDYIEQEKPVPCTVVGTRKNATGEEFVQFKLDLSFEGVPSMFQIKKIYLEEDYAPGTKVTCIPQRSTNERFIAFWDSRKLAKQ